MKKVFALLMLAIFVLSFSSCSNPKDELAYDLVAGETLEISDHTFEEEVVIYISEQATAAKRAEMNFKNCTFKDGIKIIGDKSGYIRIFKDCVFEDNNTITAVERTEGFFENTRISDDFIRLYIEVPDIEIESEALVNTISTCDITVNGNEYKKDKGTFCVATYCEDGEVKYYTGAWNE